MEQAEIVLYPSRRKWLGVLAGSSLFAAVGVLMVLESAPAGWFVLAIFGLGVPVSAMALLPSAGQLRLTSQGYEVRSLFQTHQQPWAGIERFEAYQNPGGGWMVGIIYAPDQHRASARMEALNRRLMGVDGALPDTYKMSANDLADLMNGWLARNKPM